MERVLEPVSGSWLIGLAIAIALAAATAIVGLAHTEPGDDAARIAYVVSLAAAAAAAWLAATLRLRRAAEIARLRADAAVVVFHLRAETTRLSSSGGLDPEALRVTARLGLEARVLAEALTRTGVAQEASELRVALEALELALAA